jgi:hypothetical protein
LASSDSVEEEKLMLEIEEGERSSEGVLEEKRIALRISVACEGRVCELSEDEKRGD